MDRSTAVAIRGAQRSGVTTVVGGDGGGPSLITIAGVGFAAYIFLGYIAPSFLGAATDTKKAYHGYRRAGHTDDGEPSPRRQIASRVVDDDDRVPYAEFEQNSMRRLRS